jgi:hypothetical protein
MIFREEVMKNAFGWLLELGWPFAAINPKVARCEESVYYK